jgi:hypothetical protein
LEGVFKSAVNVFVTDGPFLTDGQRFCSSRSTTFVFFCLPADVMVAFFFLRVGDFDEVGDFGTSEESVDPIAAAFFLRVLGDIGIEPSMLRFGDFDFFGRVGDFVLALRGFPSLLSLCSDSSLFRPLFGASPLLEASMMNVSEEVYCS